MPTVLKTTESEPMETPTESIPMVYETKDLPYATIMLPDQEDQLLDVYQPVEEGSFPVVVLLHGFRARKEAYIDLSQELAKNGVVVFTINYPTWIPDLAVNEKGRGLREMFDVISCAIKFARVKAPDYDGDPSKLILVGHSYGAPMGAWVALGNDEITILWNEFETNRRLTRTESGGNGHRHDQRPARANQRLLLQLARNVNDNGHHGSRPRHRRVDPTPRTIR